MKTKYPIISVCISLILMMLQCKKDNYVVPSVETGEVTEVSIKTATANGRIISDGGTKILTRGLCYGTDSIPTIDNFQVADTTNDYSYFCQLINLTPNTKYFLRSYATNAVGTGYGKTVSFTSLPGQGPVVKTLSWTPVNYNTATLFGTFNPNGSPTEIFFEVNILYGLHLESGYSHLLFPCNPKIITGNTDVKIGFNINLYGLEQKTFFSVYAKNEFGSAHGDLVPYGGLPKAVTGEATDITTTGVTLHGILNPNYYITRPSFLYGLDSFYVEFARLGEFKGGLDSSVSAVVTGLLPARKYYYTFRGTSAYGIKQGAFRTFITQGEVVNTKAATNLTQHTATLNGTVRTSYLPNSVSFEYGTSPLFGNIVSGIVGEATENQQTNVSVTLSDLASNTRYYFRMKTNDGSVLGDTYTFATKGDSGTLTDIDGNVYKTIVIGSQEWMAENLKTTRYTDGTLIPLVKTSSAWDQLALSSIAYCWYNDDSTKKDTYGALYTWYAAMRGADTITKYPSRVQGVCPVNWHLPSIAEWQKLANFLGGYSIAGGKLKEDGIEHWLAPNEGATNETDFTALPGGKRNNSGGCSDLGNLGYWWNTKVEPYRGGACSLTNKESGMNSFSSFYTYYGLSVRCVKD